MSVNTGKLQFDKGADVAKLSAKRIEEAQLSEELDEKYGYKKLVLPCEKLGWLINMCEADILDENKKMISAVDFYFLQEDGNRFKVSMPFKPYFYVVAKPDTEREVMSYLKKKFPKIFSIEIKKKEDLDLHNHLVGLKRTCLKLSFYHVDDLQNVRSNILREVRKNKHRHKDGSTYASMLTSALVGDKLTNEGKNEYKNQMDNLVDIREHDVVYHVRVSIDLNIHVALWYNVKFVGSFHPPILTHRPDLLERPDPVVYAYDIETTKLPLKFPDAETDCIMMISYMIDGQGYLICNREVLSADVDDFEYTPKPEYEGKFEVFNEPDEITLLQRFFDHILEVKPHIFVTYNGDFFDWPFVEKRAAKHGFDMKKQIGFAPDNQGEYKCRQASHLDAYKWVKRDSYLPVGSQNLKAAAKAKLRYDPVELDPEDMCRLAAEDPQTMADYSVSDAVATYYMYMKYVHPFIFALCTIIPMEPDSVLRKGSGTLCEALLMVQAFTANILYPNRHEMQLNKQTADGHVLDSETYVGGHVEALESGVFRADIPCHFRGQPSAYQELYDGVERTMKFCLETEENIPMNEVINFEQVCEEIKGKLESLRDTPARHENPIIYHLDVGAMYPNIILTNRLQPSAMVDDETCAACDFNKSGATCQRSMAWMWRGEYMPANRGEYHRIQQQLETEKFPPYRPGENSRAFHQLTKEERAEAEKKRLQEYCRRAYKKTKVMKMEERYTTVCQRENSFYVDTVRMFRDRRYEFKAALKRAKKQVAEATNKKDPTEMKKAKGLEVLYDSLQLAHKCILNSFYGYVMRKGARWYSMEMAGIVCYTGAHIIMKARELVEKIGRPLELDTDGIWCILPGSFPENFVFETTNAKKSKVTISYPGAMLNVMVKDEYTNEQYEELVDAKTLKYERRSENSIFFEVDGPYLSMILPASKEEGKKLKKRYAVFNLDGSLAELKGFEVKRRGELQLIKIFQSSVFEAFLKGITLEEVYDSVARVADYWLDVLYSKAINMPDSELFELISENRSMSKKLSEYGAQKSTSISTAKRLAEFLGDQMVKDAGLACRFIIARKPEGAPVTERAIPLAIFQSELSVKRYYLRRWTKQSNLSDFNIRSILDWNYYIERLGSAIQKIITIPAALQGVSNPVPRVRHPDWLHKRLMEKNDIYKQKRITDMFKVLPKKRPREDEESENPIEGSDDIPDLEDISTKKHKGKKSVTVVSVTTSKRKKMDEDKEDLTKTWKKVLGEAPNVDHLFYGTYEERHEWIEFHKKKWKLQAKQRQERKKIDNPSYTLPRAQAKTGLGGFLRQRARSVLSTPWKIVQLAPTNYPGRFKVFALIENELHILKLNVPRIFYVNQSIEKDGTVGSSWRKVVRLLPRSTPALHLYEYRISESDYLDNLDDIQLELSQPHIEGVYELQTPLEFRAIINLGCVCSVKRDEARKLNSQDTDTFDLEQLDFRTLAQHSYLEEGDIKHIYIYHHLSGAKQILAMFFPLAKRCYVFAADTVRTNNMPNMQSLYRLEREARLEEIPDSQIPDIQYTFDIRVEKNHNIMFKSAMQHLSTYKDEHHGPTFIAYHSDLTLDSLYKAMPVVRDFPVTVIPSNEPPNMYSVLDWQRVAARRMLQQYIISDLLISQLLEHSRYFHVPLGNLPKDPTIFVSDLFFARHLQKHNHVLWCSPTDKPDFGGKELFDIRLGTDEYDQRSVEISTSEAYPSVCLEIEILSLAVNTIIQSHHINDVDGGEGVGVSFDMIQQASLEELVSKGSHGVANNLASYDDTVLCSTAFRILKSMVQGWLRDVSMHKNELADFQLHNLYHWLSSSHSMLYDPALLKLLHNMMKKLFLQLIAEFKRLGSKIVFANFNKLIICTRKKTLADALGYLEFVAKSITSKDLFHSVDFSTVSQCWEFLLWLDNANYGGVKGNLMQSSEATVDEKGHVQTPRKLSQKSQQSPKLNESACFDKTLTNDDANAREGKDADNAINEGIVDMHFTLEKYLPTDAGIQRSFQLIIGGYISYVHQEIKREHSEILTGETPVIRRSSQTQESSQESNIVPSDPSVTANIVVLSQDLINGDLMQQLLHIAQKISAKLGRDPKTGCNRFPILPGSHIELNDPTLEFVKSVCHVLALDSHVTQQVEKVKRSVLRLIGVGEFSSSAEWRDPCASYVMPNIVCVECKLARDVDLCRDAITGDDEAQNEVGWSCTGCGAMYNTKIIEYQLLESLQRKCAGNVLQDLVCVKCCNVKQTNMATYCECAGNFNLTVSMKQFKKTLTIFRNIAKYAKMETLEEHVQWLLHT